MNNSCFVEFRKRGTLGTVLVESTTIDSDHYVGIREEGSRVFEGFHIFVSRGINRCGSLGTMYAIM